MKMDTMNISLPATMAEFVRRRVDQDYGNASEYFRALVRERMQAEIETDLKLLETATRHAAAGPTAADVEQVLAVQRAVRKGHTRDRGV